MTLTLSGLADDTALVSNRQPADLFASTLTTDDRDTRFKLNAALGKVVVVGDITGDLIDDVVLLMPAGGGLVPVPFRAGLFFSRVGGFPDTLTLADADVIFQGELPAGQTVATSSTQWLFPLRLSTQDGETIQVVARAVDEAGNVGPESDPITIQLDNVGPAITATQADHLLEGSVRDGSGVSSVEVSLDGGIHYQPVALRGETWSFDMASWSGARQSFAMLRAVDVWGNVTHEMIPVDTSAIPTPTPSPSVWRLYLPMVLIQAGR